ncbi:lytic transglycosylase domain-containing protein [Neisseria chenwenguii]|uniref:lytic transglycosylase domain-containing protein n=1 Tax=Neisseria chenwenguii TaxID=1853278 RepID=UPI0018DFFE88|nr:lytic transglycosylase domain-containing protein [Neisseria chenwenguii]
MKNKKFTCTKYFILLTTLFISPLTHADKISGCLKGYINTPECRRMIANYWQHAPSIERIAVQEGVEPELLKALIAYESSYNHRAVSRVQATGLTQVMPGTARGMGVHPDKLYIPTVSIRAGARYLRQMFRDFGRLDLALAAYNAGPGRVRKAGRKVPNIKETQNYVRNVSALYTEFKRKTAYANNTGRNNIAAVSGKNTSPSSGTQPAKYSANSAYQSHTSNVN